MGSRFRVLHERGMALQDDVLDAIVAAIESGVDWASSFFRTEETLSFIASDNQDWLGHAPDQKAINLPLPWLNWVASVARTPDALASFCLTVRVDDFRMEVSFQEYLKAAGIEEMIHHLQDVGHPLVQATLPRVAGSGRSFHLAMALSAHEVEARRLTDEILVARKQCPLWSDYDSYLLRVYRDRYGLSGERLAQLPEN